MKKIFALLCFTLIIPTVAFSYLYENETSNPQVLKEQGFSRSMLEVVDWANYRNTDKTSHYVRYYQPKDHKYLGKVYSRIKQYVDPIQDDGFFGDRQIEFSNTWNSDLTRYSTDKNQTTQVEDL